MTPIPDRRVKPRIPGMIVTQAAARRLKKGTQITLQVAVTDIRLFAGNTAHIHVVPT